MNTGQRIPPEHDGLPSEPQLGATVRNWDRRAIQGYGIPAVVLMENAGAAAARTLRGLALSEPTADPEPFRIFCGPGNNGGDGFVVARYLHNYGYDVRVFVCGEPKYPPGSESAVQLEIVRRLGLPTAELRHVGPGVKQVTEAGGTAIDALFGTGLSRPLRSPFAEYIVALNQRPESTIALDLPSGLDADTGSVHGVVVRAQHTLTFAALKVGLTCGDGPAASGQIHVLDIGLPRALWETDKGD